jgi:3-keto-5-aminohexanoate cleavage enzyme
MPSPNLIWLEVALNGSWGKKLQPNSPVDVSDIISEGIACVRAGAAIVHVHAFDPDTGHQSDSEETYVAIIEGIRGAADAIVYPTLSADTSNRYHLIEKLARRGLLEWAVVDPGSVNISLKSDISEEREGWVYVNSERTIRQGLLLAKEFGFHPSYACYEAGFIRLGAALYRQLGGAPHPIYRLMFTDTMTFGFPPQLWALDALFRLLSLEAPGAPAMVAGLGVDIFELAQSAMRLGVHVRVGLEDAALGCEASNIELVERAVTLVPAGIDLANANDVRRDLARLTESK